MDGIIHIDGQRWYTRDELAGRLGVTVRTITRRVNRGEIEKKTTAGGVVYRVATAAEKDTRGTARDTPWDRGTGQDRTPRGTAQDAARDTVGHVGQDRGQDGTGHPVGQAAGHLSHAVDRLAQANADLAATIDRLTRQLELQSAEMDAWRTRAEQADRDAVRWRAKFHVARGRAEMLDE